MHPVLHRIINRRNVIIAGVALLAAFAFWYFRDLQFIYEALTDYFRVLASHNMLLAAALFFALAAASAILTFFTSTPLVPIAVEVFGPLQTFWMISIAWLLGGAIAYWICYGLRGLIGHTAMFRKAETYQRQLSGHSEFLLILLFRLAVPAEIGSYALGLLRYPFWKYMAITFIAELPFAFIALYSTSTFFGRQPLAFIAIICIGMALMGVTVYYFYKRLHRLTGKPVQEPDPDDIL